MRRYGRPIEEYVEHFSPVVAAGLCTGAMGNKSPQEIAVKAFQICDALAKLQGMKPMAQLDAEEEAERKKAPPT